MDVEAQDDGIMAKIIVSSLIRGGSCRLSRCVCYNQAI